MTIRTMALMLGISMAAWAQPAARQFMVRAEMPKLLHPETITPAERLKVGEHGTYMWSLYVQGKLTLAVRSTDGPWGFYLVNAPDAQAAEEIMKNDPLMQSGLAKAELFPLRTMFDRGSDLARRERKQIAVDPKTLAGYAGTYRIAPTFDLSVALEGDALTAATAVMGPARVKLVPVAEGKFVFEAADVQLEFVRDEKGAVTHCVLHDNGRQLKGPRAAEPQKP